MNNLSDTENEKIESSASDENGASKDLKLIEKIIDRGSQKLEDESYFPRIQDVLKAIQLREKVKKMVKEEDSKSFWDMIEEVRQEELPKMYPEDNLESQLKAAIYS
jgi:ribosomal protein L30/L7E